MSHVSGYKKHHYIRGNGFLRLIQNFYCEQFLLVTNHPNAESTFNQTHLMQQVFFPVPTNEERKKKQKQVSACPSFFETKTWAHAQAPLIRCTTLDFKQKTTDF